MRRFGLVLVVVAACGPRESNWSQRLARAECSFAERCDASNFYFVFDDEGACRDEKEAIYVAAEADLLGCVFDKDAASDCLNALGQSCKTVGREFDTLVAPCGVVWTCPNGGGDTFDTGAQGTPAP